MTDGTVRRLSGTSRFATAAAVADDVFSDGAPAVFLATGANFPDALAGGPPAGLAGGPLLLVNADCAPTETIDAVDRLAPDRLVVLGGPPVVSDAAASLQPCGGGSSGVPPPTFELDPSLEPAVAELPPRQPGGAPRTVARLSDQLGTNMDFAEAELVVSAERGPDLDALVARYGGEIVVTHDFAAAGLDQIPPVHVVRIDPATADPDELSADARILDPASRGTHGVSSDAGLGTLAASMAASADGMVVGFNVLDEGTGILEETTTEAPQASTTANFTPAAGQPYSTNAFQWAYMSATHAQGIGIAEAWRLLASAGALSGTVDVGVIDDGFGNTDNDRPANSVGFGPGFGARGVIGCGGPTNTCPWHGHWVSSALAAVPDNSVGAAGSGGPVSRLIMVQRGRGSESTVEALLTAANQGARIMNMSFRGKIPASTASTVAPLQNVLNGLYLHHNRLFFASAGNDSEQIDGQTCSPTECWENTLYYPCEFDVEVVCVGGVAAGSQNRDPGSNFGASVDVFGPYTTFVGPDPDRPANEPQTVNGTSFASPIVAGVAALVWEAYRNQPPFSNPSNLEVYRAITETASLSPDANVTRILNAPAAARRALQRSGGGAVPTVELVNPTGDITVDYGVARGFEATANDAEDGQDCCTLRWVSNADGRISVARQFAYAFPNPGPRTISVTATDGNGNESPARTFNVTAVNQPPAVTMTRPTTEEQTLYQGVRYPFVGAITDANEPDINCDESLTWSSDVDDGGLPVTRCRPSVTFSQVGPRGITVTGTDERGLQTAVTRNVDVVAIPPDSEPIVVIHQPDPGSVASCFGNRAIGEATLEPDEQTPLTYRWTLIPESTPARELGTTPQVDWGYSDAEEGQFATLRLEATDNDGTGSAEVTVELDICLQ